MILFDGCSWTYGDELDNPERDRFSTLIGEDHVNLGKNGKSNDGILRTTLDYCESNHVDIAVIQFTKFSRTEIRKSNSNEYDFLSIGNVLKGNETKELSKIYYEHIHNKNLHVANYHKNKFLLEYYFKTKGIKYYFININNEDINVPKSSWYNMIDKKPVTSMVSLIGNRFDNPENYCQGRYKKEDKRSGGHPNKRGHSIIADHISLNIRKAS